MPSHTLTHWVKELEQKNALERIELYMLALTKLYFKSANLTAISSGQGVDFPLNSLNDNDFYIAHLLLKKLHKELNEIEYDERTKSVLFGEVNYQNIYLSLAKNISIANTAYNSLSKANRFNNIQDVGSALFITGIVVTGIMAIVSTVMPWFIPVALIGAALIYFSMTNKTSNHYLKKGQSTVSTLEIMGTDTDIDKSTPLKEVESEYQASFFRKTMLPLSLKTIAEKKAQDLNTIINPPPAGNSGYVDSETRRIANRGRIRASDPNP